MKTNKTHFDPSIVYDLEVLNDYIMRAEEDSAAAGETFDPDFSLPECSYNLYDDEGLLIESNRCEGSLLAMLANEAMKGRGPKTCQEIPTDSDYIMTLAFDYSDGKKLFLQIQANDWYDLFNEQIDEVETSRRYLVKYCTAIESNPATFPGTSREVRYATIDEAKSYIDAQLEGAQSVCDCDTNPAKGVHWFEIVDEDTFTPEDGYGDPVYASNWYYNK